VSLGVARGAAAADCTPQGIRDAVRAVLCDPGYRRNDMRMREESERLPGPDHAVAWLERLASERQPLVVAS
jgi:UDP:flavonoid glycosyltransferase YjiC (YdhE family)